MYLSIPSCVTIYKYYIPERVIVKKCHPEEYEYQYDIYIPKGDIFHYHALGNVIFTLIYRTSLLLHTSGEIGPTWASIQDSGAMTFQIIG